MKIQLCFKTPDVVHYALQDEEFLNLSEDEQDTIKEVIEKYIEYGELITIELDTETQEAIVIKVK